MVNCTPDFTDHPQVINGCSELFRDVWGEDGVGARSAVGMGSLPGNISTEIEAIFELPRNMAGLAVGSDVSEATSISSFTSLQPQPLSLTIAVAGHQAVQVGHLVQRQQLQVLSQ